MEHELQHHGVLGQKWGVRRYQNKDGSLTSAGRKHYADDSTPQKVQNGEKKSGNGKKIAAGATVVAGTVLTAYLLKKYGGKSVSELSAQAQTGKAAIESVVKTASITQTAVHTTPIQITPIKTIPIHQVSLNQVKAAPKISNNYNFETLMRQNSDLLKKMYAELG